MNHKLSAVTASVLMATILVLVGWLLWQSIKLDSWTYDERLHLQSATEWLDKKVTPSDPFNPPLSKLPILLPILIQGKETTFSSYWSDPFLVRPRLTTVLITLLTLSLVGYLTARLISTEVAVLSVYFLGLEPLFLAHGHIFTTDMMTALWFSLAYLGFISWLRSGRNSWWWLSWVSSWLLMVTKLTAIPMLITAMIISWWWQRRPDSDQISIDSTRLNLIKLLSQSLDWRGWLLGLIIVWASYGLAWTSPFPGWPVIPLGGFMQTVGRAACFITCPKYEATRRLVYFGQVAQTGWWSYPLVALLIKTSLTVGITWLLLGTKPVRKYWSIILPPILSVLGWVSLGRYSVGARHLLPALPWLAIAAAVLVVNWWHYPSARPKSNQHHPPLISPSTFIIRSIIIFIMGFHLLTALATPDYLSYFNPLIGTKRGGQIIADSNLDWGQNVARLATAINQNQVPIKGQLYLASSSSYQPLSDYGLVAKSLPPADQLSLTRLSGNTLIVGRHSWYVGGYDQLPDLARHNKHYIINDTMLIFYPN